MVSKFTLLGILLLATAVLAVPSSPVEALVARGHEDRQSQPTNLIASRAELVSNVNTVVPEQCVSVDWAGACVNIGTPSFTFVTASITVPAFTVKYKDDTFPSIWITMGIITCPTEFLSIGLLTEEKDGKPQYLAFYDWLPGLMDTTINRPDRLTIRPGQEIVLTIKTDPARRGEMTLSFYDKHDVTAKIEQVVSGSDHCWKDVGWGVTIHDSVAFEHFTGVIFHDAFAEDKGRNRYPAANATIISNRRAFTAEETGVMTNVYPSSQVLIISRAG